MADEEPRNIGATDPQGQEDWQSNVAHGTAKATDHPQQERPVDANAAEDDTEHADSDDDLGIPLDKVEALLSASTDTSSMTPQMRRIAQRQQENSRRVEETIKGTKANPSWFVPLFCALMVIGLVWAVVYYLTSNYPIPNIGAWNLAIAFAIIMVGFIMTMWWR